MSMCSNTMNSFLALTGSSHGRCSSAFTQYFTLPCFPSKEVAKALKVRGGRAERTVWETVGGLRLCMLRYGLQKTVSQYAPILTSEAGWSWKQTHVGLSAEQSDLPQDSPRLKHREYILNTPVNTYSTNSSHPHTRHLCFSSSQDTQVSLTHLETMNTQTQHSEAQDFVKTSFILMFNNKTYKVYCIQMTNMESHKFQNVRAELDKRYVSLNLTRLWHHCEHNHICN